MLKNMGWDMSSPPIGMMRASEHSITPFAPVVCLIVIDGEYKSFRNKHSRSHFFHASPQTEVQKTRLGGFAEEDVPSATVLDGIVKPVDLGSSEFRVLLSAEEFQKPARQMLNITAMYTIER